MTFLSSLKNLSEQWKLRYCKTAVARTMNVTFAYTSITRAMPFHCLMGLSGFSTEIMLTVLYSQSVKVVMIYTVRESRSLYNLRNPP